MSLLKIFLRHLSLREPELVNWILKLSEMNSQGRCSLLYLETSRSDCNGSTTPCRAVISLQTMLGPEVVGDDEILIDYQSDRRLPVLVPFPPRRA